MRVPASLRTSSLVTLAFLGAALAACSAGTGDTTTGVGGDGSGAGGPSTSPGSTGSANGGSDQGSTGSQGGGFVTSSGTGGSGGSVPVNPCGTDCGPMELCDGIHKGLDDDCDGTVDEDCPCGAGQASSCFKGDPSYRTDPGCFPGSMTCTENGTWGPCTGGNHATEMCFSADPMGCHPISAVPFATTDLVQGAGNFDDNADPGTSLFEVACPSGVSPCPAVQGVSQFQALQSGQYDVTYTKKVNGVTDSCTFPLYVGAPGLRVELEWNWGGFGKDLDLHLHKPVAPSGSGQGWAPDSGDSAGSADCTWWNCTANDYQTNSGPEWFPAPVAWMKDPNFNENTCYFAPRGVGAQWQAIGKGCHNPRLDLDNVSCDVALTDPDDSNFCAPENANVDLPPWGEWFRVGVFGYSVDSPIQPTLKIWCDGALAAELGTSGFNAPVQMVDRGMWLAADVLFKPADACNSSQCVVKPIYANGDATAKLPVVLDEAVVTGSFGPAAPAAP